MKPVARRAFTLIELLIVVAIIAILAAIALPNFLEAQTRSKVARTKSDMRTLATALEAYVVDNNRYPGDQDNNPFHPTERGFYRLTTPVAYITSFFTDPFSDAIRSTDPNNPDVAAFYVLACGDDNAPNHNPTRNYVVISIGPDRKNSSNNKDRFPHSSSHLGLYDPTNGAISNGDLLRFGGNYRAGGYLLSGDAKNPDSTGFPWWRWNVGPVVPN